MPDHRAAVDGVSAYWDALVLGQETTGIDLDPDVAEAIRRFQALAAAPPSTARERVWQTMHAAAAIQRESEDPMQPSVVLDRSRPLLSRIRPGAVPLPWRGRTHWLLAQLATAALLVLTLVASFLVFGPPRGNRGSEAPAFIPAISATPEMVGAPVAEFLWQTTGGPDLPLGDPFKIAIDPAGNLWVPDGLNSRFQIFAPDGTFLEAWGTEGSEDGQFDFPLSGYGYGTVVWDADGNFYVTDSGNYRIQKFGPDRTFITAWGSQGQDDGQFIGLNDLALDQQGRLFATDHERDDIQVFDTEGHFLAVWGAPGMKEGQFMNPGGLAVDAGGNLYVIEFLNHRVQKLAPDGTVLGIWGAFGRDEGEFNNPTDVTLDADGRVFVTDWANHRVQVFDTDGQFLTAWGEPGSDAGQFNGPIGVALDGNGSIYVSEDGGDRVQKFRLLPPLAPE
jgi:DNA-binding beta-propeller fold protein YncE